MADSPGSGRAEEGGTVRDVVCPFCGLGCDDLTARVAGAAVAVEAPGCPMAERLFARAGAPVGTPRIAAAEATRDAAIEVAAELLRGSRAPLFAGLGADVAGLRALVALAEATGGVLDHYASDGLARNMATLQRRGWVTTTLAEVRNRCDLLVVAGPDPTPAFQRLFERLFGGAPLFLEAGSPRAVVFLGAVPGPESAAALAGAAVTVLPVDGRLSEAIGALRALVERRPLAGDWVAGVPRIALQTVADRLRAARYPVLAWNALAFDAADGDLAVEGLCAVVEALNRTTRAAALPLAGRDNLVGANQVVGWTLGYPLRTAIRGGVATHDPWRYATRAALADADLMVWASAFRSEPPPEFAGPVVALAHPDTAFAAPPAVMIPVGTPGIDHSGQVFRTDAVVALPLAALRATALPSVAEVVGAIRAALGGAH